MEQKLIMTFKSDGTSEVSTQGFKGKKCVDVAKAFENLYSSQESYVKTSDFYTNEYTEVEQNINLYKG